MGILNKIMRSVLAIALLGAFMAAEGLNDASFIQHVSQQGLSYGTIEEFNFRRGLYEEMD